MDISCALVWRQMQRVIVMCRFSAQEKTVRLELWLVSLRFEASLSIPEISEESSRTQML